ncbi:hypothetical protein [Streptomyces sp. NPDC096153]|uniref:hypothetical protein n=1 Tax=Streptomyces sp. NPDC096153 TaxID=3155548 RepID=UPI00331D8279
MDAWMQFWRAVWVGSSLISGRIGAWLRQGVGLRLLVIGIACGFVKGLPRTTEIAYTLAAGWFVTAVVLGLRAKAPDVAAPAPAQKATEEAGLTPDAVVRALHQLAAPHVHISALADCLKRPAEEVRSALSEMGVRHGDGVRMKGRGVSTGVKARDIPPLSPDQSPAEEGVLTSNNNSNNGSEGQPRKGFLGGYRFWVTDDPDNPARAHVHHHETGARSGPAA